MRPVTPRGFRDVLFAEAAEREAVTRAITRVFKSWGYGPVETPVVEEYATLEAAVSRSLETDAFRLFDMDGALLALRPEMTVPIARLTASRLGGEPGPHRFRYVASVFRENASLRGQARQFTQAGVELVGAPGPGADAEIVALLLDTLVAAGLREFTVSVGSVAFLRAVIASARMDESWDTSVLQAAHGRDFVAIEALSRQQGVSAAVGDALRALSRLRGGPEALVAAGQHARACGCEESLDELLGTYEVLDACGLTERITVDFSMMRSFDYYTGLVLEVFSPGLGVAIGGGGRYDRVLAEFDAAAPAAGFALGIERIMIALANQSATPSVPPLDAVVGGTRPAEVFAVAAQLRAAGWRAQVAHGCAGEALVTEAARTGALMAVEVDGPSAYALDRNGVRLGELPAPLEGFAAPLPDDERCWQ